MIFWESFCSIHSIHTVFPMCVKLFSMYTSAMYGMKTSFELFDRF